MRVFIENEAGSFVKHLHNEKTLERTGETLVSRAYPLPYGFVLETTGEDGDNVDCFVMTERRLRTGEMVECEPVGLMEQIEDGEIDHKVLAVLNGEQQQVDGRAQRELIEFARHVFDHVPGKNMQVVAFRGPEAAIEYVRLRRDHAAVRKEF